MGGRFNYQLPHRCWNPNQFGHRFIYDWTLKLKLWSVEMYYLTATTHSVLYIQVSSQGVVPDSDLCIQLLNEMESLTATRSQILVPGRKITCTRCRSGPFLDASLC